MSNMRAIGSSCNSVRTRRYQIEIYGIRIYARIDVHARVRTYIYVYMCICVYI